MRRHSGYYAIIFRQSIQRFGNVQGGHETIEDIESRIAEIFQSQKGVAGVITKENVECNDLNYRQTGGF